MEEEATGTPEDRSGGDRRIPSVGLVSPCGWGNLGDVGIQEAVIRSIRREMPDVQFIGVTLVPGETEERHGIPSFPLAGAGTGGHAVVWKDDPGPKHPLFRWAERVEDRLFDVRFVGRLWSMMLDAARTAWIEAKHVVLAARCVRSLDLLMASGGGQFEELWGGAFGQPYSLFKWSSLARWAGTPFVISSVGVGTLRSRTARFFLRHTVLGADRVTCRDRESCEMVTELASDRVRPSLTPDLAFALADLDSWPPASTVRPLERPRTIGVSPMAYHEPHSWPQDDAEAYAAYVDKMAALCASLLDSGSRVILFTTANSDRRTADEVADRLSSGGWGGPGFSNRDTGSFDGLQTTLDDVDAVVASRLHGVVLSHVSDRPVLALAYDRKVYRHMEAMGQSDYLLGIDDFEVATAKRLLADLLGDREAREELRERVDASARRVRDELRALVHRYLTADGIELEG